MMYKNIIIPLLLAATLGGTLDQSEKPKNAMPVLWQSPPESPVGFAKHSNLEEVNFLFLGKYRLADTVNLEKPIENKEDIVDFFAYDSFSTDGLAVYVDYNTNLHYRFETLTPTNVENVYHFPVFIFNPTRETKLFKVKHSKVFGLQEAIDTSDNDTWYPIDCKFWQFCSCGNYAIKIHPLETIILAVPKYEGDQKGPMRLRFINNKQIYISQPFIGNYNRAQFTVCKDGYLDQEISRPRDMEYRFLGTKPKGY